jgi:hypothetical protein
VIDVLSDLFVLCGVPGYIRSENGSEFVAKAVRELIATVGAQKLLTSSPAAMGEWLHRKLQCASPGRTAQW